MAPVSGQATVIRKPITSAPANQAPHAANAPADDKLPRSPETVTAAGHVQNMALRPLPPTPAEELSKLTTLKALKSYTARERGEFSFEKDDLITCADKVNEDWWKGKLGDKDGYFPSLNVQAVPSDSVGTRFDPVVQFAPGISAPGRVKALFDYSSQNPDDLDFQRGDMIYVLEANYKHWWKGTVLGTEGWFPTNYVESLPPSTAELEDEKITHVISMVDFDPKNPELFPRHHGKRGGKMRRRAGLVLLQTNVRECRVVADH